MKLSYVFQFQGTFLLELRGSCTCSLQLQFLLMAHSSPTYWCCDALQRQLIGIISQILTCIIYLAHKVYSTSSKSTDVKIYSQTESFGLSFERRLVLRLPSPCFHLVRPELSALPDNCTIVTPPDVWFTVVDLKSALVFGRYFSQNLPTLLAVATIWR